MASSEQINWQDIHLSDDEASAQGTRAVRFVVQQVEKAQKNPYLKPILNNLMMAHALRIHNYEPPAQIPPPQEVPNAGAGRGSPLPRVERGPHSQDEGSARSSSSPSRRPRRPLERETNSPPRMHYHRHEEKEGKRRRSPSREASSSPSTRGRRRERLSCKEEDSQRASSFLAIKSLFQGKLLFSIV